MYEGLSHDEVWDFWAEAPDEIYEYVDDLDCRVSLETEYFDGRNMVKAKGFEIHFAEDLRKEVSRFCRLLEGIESTDWRDSPLLPEWLIEWKGYFVTTQGTNDGFAVKFRKNES